MDQVLQFVIHHWPMWLALVFVIIMLTQEQALPKMQGVTMLSAERAVNLINRENALILDIRDPEAFKAGHIVDAINLPAHEASVDTTTLDKDKGKALLFIDDTGKQAASAAANLHKAGFERVFVLTGGLAAWREAQLPLVKE